MCGWCTIIVWTPGVSVVDKYTQLKWRKKKQHNHCITEEDSTYRKIANTRASDRARARQTRRLCHQTSSTPHWRWCWGRLVCPTREQPAGLANFRAVYRQGCTLGKTGEAAVRLWAIHLDCILPFGLPAWNTYWRSFFFAFEFDFIGELLFYTFHQ